MLSRCGHSAFCISGTAIHLIIPLMDANNAARCVPTFIEITERILYLYTLLRPDSQNGSRDIFVCIRSQSGVTSGCGLFLYI